MRKKRLVIVGWNFAGFTAGLELTQRSRDYVVTLISKTDDFLFIPSLVWVAAGVPFGLKSRARISFPVRSRFEKGGVRFKQEDVTRLDLENRRVVTERGEEPYDCLMISTGVRPNYGAIPGLGPRGYTQSIMSLADAENAGAAFERFVKTPGPVVVGAAPEAAFFAAGYEFLFTLAQELEKRGVRGQAPLTWVTPEPFLGHLGGVGSPATRKRTEQLFETFGIAAITNAAVREISRGTIRLADGAALPFGYAMLVPPSLGVDAVRACTPITNALGFVRTNACCQTERYPEVFAGGVAVAVEPTEQTQVRCGVPVTGQRSEAMGRTCAENMVALLEGKALSPLPPPEAEADFEPQVDPITGDWISGSEARWAKLTFDKYFNAG